MARIRGIRLGRPFVGHTDEADPDVVFVRIQRLALLIFALICVAAMVMAIGDTELSPGRTLMVVTLIAAFGTLHFLCGHWGSIRNDAQLMLFLSASLVLTVAAIRLWPGAGLLLFIAYWAAFSWLRLVPSLVYAILLTIATQWGFRVFSLADVLHVRFSWAWVIPVVAAVLVCGLLAKLIEELANQSERSAVLLAELRATQAEITRKEREAGVREERARLAGEIHDTIAQHFTSILTNLQAAEARHQEDSNAAISHLEAAETAARQGILDARALLAALQPNILDERALPAALEHIVSEADQSGPTRHDFTVNGLHRTLDPARQAILVRTLQEALRNIHKHARAKNVAVELSWQEDEVILGVEDDGVGFDTTAVPRMVDGHHLGLETMTRRVEHAGGTFVLDSTPGEGTSIAISFPITDEEQP